MQINFDSALISRVCLIVLVTYQQVLWFKICQVIPLLNNLSFAIIKDSEMLQLFYGYL